MLGPLSNGKYITVEELSINLGSSSSNLTLKVPAGFQFDVSIPRVFTAFLSRDDKRFLKAAAFHDYCVHELKWDRVSSAAPFSICLKKAGVPIYLRLLMVMAVIIHKWS